MKITVRLDDINPRMDFEKFLEVKRLLDKYRVCPLIGVVPDNRDERLQIEKADKSDYIEMIRNLQSQGWVVAMHGVTHEYLDRKSNKSEFCGLPYENQLKKLQTGKDMLEKQIGSCVTVFFAPSNHHDNNTLRALKNLGFSHISYGLNDNIYEEKQMLFIPISNGIRDVSRVIRWYRKHSGIATLVIHSNSVSKMLLKRYDRLLKIAYDRGLLINYSELLSLGGGNPINKKWILTEKVFIKIESILSKCKQKLLFGGKGYK